MTVRSLVVGLAGHIDHGKTALVQALTGQKGDRLKAERDRGITIDLGFASWRPTPHITIAFIDMPGHEDFIRNMAAGTSGVQAMILVISAAEGIMPQTREHLAIAYHLGCRKILLCITKADLAAPAQVDQRLAEGRALITAWRITPAAEWAVSVRDPESIKVLGAALLRLAEEVPEADIDLPFRMPVDRAFQRPGIGTVVTGTIKSGSIKAQEMVALHPAGKRLRVRAVQAHGDDVPVASGGMRAALALADIARDDISRGDVLTVIDGIAPITAFDAQVQMDDAVQTSQFRQVFIHTGTTVSSARLLPLASDDRVLAAGLHLAQIQAPQSISILAGDRFVLRSGDGRATLGGGIVLALDAPTRRRRQPERLQKLALLATRGLADSLEALGRLPPFALNLDEMAREHGIKAKPLHDAARKDTLIVMQSKTSLWHMHPAIVLTLQRTIIEKLTNHHESQPDQPGLTLAKLLMALPIRILPEVFPALIRHLAERNHVSQEGDWVRLPGHRPELGAAHAALWQLMEPFFIGETRLNPPRVGAIAEVLNKRADSLRGVLKRLARMGRVQEIAEDLFMAHDAVTDLEQAMRDMIGSMEGDWFTAAQYRDATGMGRKIAILVLEFFDRQGTTLRKGDLRRLNPLARSSMSSRPKQAFD